MKRPVSAYHARLRNPFGAGEGPERGQTKHRNGNVIAVDARAIEQQNPSAYPAVCHAKRQHQRDGKGADAAATGLATDHEDDDEQEKPARHGQGFRIWTTPTPKALKMAACASG